MIDGVGVSGTMTAFNVGDGFTADAEEQAARQTNRNKLIKREIRPSRNDIVLSAGCFMEELYHIQLIFIITDIFEYPLLYGFFCQIQ